MTALSLFVSTILFLKPSVGDMKQTLHVRFADVNRISEGTRVLFAGKPVGEVVAIDTLEDVRKESSDSLGRIYCYELTLKIDSSIDVYNTDEISSASAGLMGEKVISIVPKAVSKNREVYKIGQEPIYADAIDNFDHAWSELSDLAQEMQSTFKEINGWLSRNGDAIGNTVHEIEKTLTGINQGSGTLGRIMAGDELYLSVNAILAKLNTLMNDVNQYGVLFHLNKGWQRVRLQKTQGLSALSTPASFKNYFSQEIDNINTAMGRLALCLEKAEQHEEPILQNPLFQKEFSELLRQAEELSTHLKFYNQQFMDLSK
jgi:phospholipid/cholesterol/gamma-HCH transport system substrate-binding protein